MPMVAHQVAPPDAAAVLFLCLMAAQVGVAEDLEEEAASVEDSLVVAGLRAEAGRREAGDAVESGRSHGDL
jgi:hypothetical protein